MKGYFCVHCGEEVPVTIKDNRTWFYCKCTDAYNHVAYYREIDKNDEKENETEIKDVLDVPYYKAKEKVKEYLRNNVFVSVVAEKTCLDLDMIQQVLYDLFECNGD